LKKAEKYMSQKTVKVIIIGGGFGGLNAALEMANSNIEVILIDKKNHHLFQPLLYQVATGGLSPGDISYPLRAAFKKNKNVRVLLEEVLSIDPIKKQIIMRYQSMSYDYLIVAAGSQHHYFGNDSWGEHASGLKSIRHAVNIRSQILSTLEYAESLSEEIDDEKLRFVIVGGGPTGVELAGAVAELLRETLIHDFRKIKPEHVKITLIEGSDRLLPTYPPSLSQRAASTLKKMGVECLEHTRVEDIAATSIRASGTQGSFDIPVSAVIWAAGVKPSPLATVLKKDCQAELDSHGRVHVDGHCRLPNDQHIFVIGDMAHCKDRHDNPLPGIAAVAMQQGRHVAHVLKKQQNNKPYRQFRYKDKGQLAVIGRAAAVGYRRSLRLGGFPAWIVWLFVHLLYLIGFQNRIIVAVQWAINFITFNRGARLIIDETDADDVISSAQKEHA
jgi:NADH dehydrogenase